MWKFWKKKVPIQENPVPELSEKSPQGERTPTDIYQELLRRYPIETWTTTRGNDIFARYYFSHKEVPDWKFVLSTSDSGFLVFRGETFINIMLNGQAGALGKILSREITKRSNVISEERKRSEQERLSSAAAKLFNSL